MSLTKDIQQAICKAEIQKDNLVSENFNYFFTGELDVISVNKTGYVSEFEVKVSRPDFKADSKKKKWYYFDISLTPKYIPNYFTYVCPMGLILDTELKPYMGLIYYFEDGQLITIKKPKLIHKHRHDLARLLTKMCRVNNWKHYIGAQKLTILNRQIKARNTPEAKSEWLEIAKNVKNNFKNA